MLYDFISVGGVTEDVIFFTKEGLVLNNKKDLLRQKLLAFEYGAKINITKSYSCFGGGASNTAVNLAKMGFKVACLANVGRDVRGQKVLDNLKANGIDTKIISFDNKRNTGFSFIINSNNDRIIFSCRGTNDNLSISSEQKKILKKSEWIYLTSLPNKSDNILKDIFSVKNKIAWNPGLKQLSGGINKIDKYLKETNVLMLNKDEALELIKKTPSMKGYKDKYLLNEKNLLKILKNSGPEIIILTNGLKGAYYYDGKNFHHQDVYRRSVEVDATGVGDAFNSTFIGMMLKLNGNFKKAMYWGMKNTASLVTKFGAQNGLMSLKNVK